MSEQLEYEEGFVHGATMRRLAVALAGRRNGAFVRGYRDGWRSTGRRMRTWKVGR